VDHPHLHRPWHALHPCQTATRMRLLLDPDPVPLAGAPAGASARQATPEPAPAPATSAPAVQGASAGRLGEARGGGEDGGCDGRTDGLRYMLGWYSLIAPALGLPAPLALWAGPGLCA